MKVRYETRLVQFVELASRHTDDCIIWPFAVNSSGYPTFSIRRRKVYAHRVACQAIHGAPPDGTQAAHTCGVRACINPRHLRWATRAENESDKLQHGTGNRGERHGMSRLTADDVRAIRGLLAEGNTYEAIAQQFSVTKTAIGHINRKSTWGWLE